jgi:hypothetical protein
MANLLPHFMGVFAPLHTDLVVLKCIVMSNLISVDVIPCFV